MGHICCILLRHLVLQCECVVAHRPQQRPNMAHAERLATGITTPPSLHRITHFLAIPPLPILCSVKRTTRSATERNCGARPPEISPVVCVYVSWNVATQPPMHPFSAGWTSRGQVGPGRPQAARWRHHRAAFKISGPVTDHARPKTSSPFSHSACAPRHRRVIHSIRVHIRTQPLVVGLLDVGPPAFFIGP